MITTIVRELAQGVRAHRKFNAGVRILTYHGVIERITDRRVERSFHTLADFRQHISILRRCHAMNMDEIASALPDHSLVPRVAITFDDGFRNNMLAAELLAAAKLPVTIFITSGAVARERAIWPTLLRLVLARGSRRAIHLAGVSYELDRNPEAFGDVRKLFKAAATDRRHALWVELLGQLGDGELDALIASFPSIAQMSWRDVTALQSTGVTFGSHGFEHELHHAEQPASVRRHELDQSKVQIEGALGKPCRWFAFPNGSFNPDSAAELRAAGYDMGFTMVSRAARQADDLAVLPRIMPGPGPEKLATALAFGN